MPVARLPQVHLNYLQTAFDKQSVPLVMVHGLATNLAFWYPLLPTFTDQRPVLLYDLRGHGRSGMPKTGYTPSDHAEDLGQLLDFLGIERADFLVHSFGGSVTLTFAHRYPHRVNRLILADVRVKLLQAQQLPRDWPNWARLAPSLAKVGIHLDEADPEGGYHLLEAMMRWELTRSHHPDEPVPFPKLLAQLLPQIGSRRTCERWLELLETTNARRDFLEPEAMTLTNLTQFTFPTLAVYGENSPTLPTAQALRELWSHASFEYIPNAGHFFPLSKPQQLITCALDFLNEPSYLPS